MKKMMLIGSVGCGKTTLMQRLKGEELIYDKTQSVEISDYFVDTPGEFVQKRYFYNSLQVTSQDVDVVALLQSIDEKFEVYPPGFTSMFAKPCIGVVTKTDLVNSEADLLKAEESLRHAGVPEIIHVSSVENQGIDSLLDFLKN